MIIDNEAWCDGMQSKKNLYSKNKIERQQKRNSLNAV
jgi:hypothetical protein